MADALHGTLPAGLELDRVLAQSPRSTVLRVTLEGRAMVLRLGASVHAVATEVAPFSSVRDPGLVAPERWGTTSDGQRYVLRPFVEGLAFDDFAASASDEETLAVTRSLLRSLQALHRAGLVHRDIKASNVIVGGAQAFLVDLDLLARSASAERAGTRGHIAPEVLLGHRHGPASDLFSLGAMLAFALCGTPHAGFTQRFPRLSFWEAAALDPERSPAGLRPLLRALVRRNPKDRPSSARYALEHLPQTADPPEPPPVELPFFAGRAASIDGVTQGFWTSHSVVVVGVTDTDEIDAVAREVELALALSEATGDALPCVPERLVELVHVPPAAWAESGAWARSLVERVRAALLPGGEHEAGLVLVLEEERARSVRAILRDDVTIGSHPRLRFVSFPRVTQGALEGHLLALSDGASPDTARSLARSLMRWTRGRLSEINRRLARAHDEGVLRPLESAYALLRSDWPRGDASEAAFATAFETLDDASRRLLRWIAILGDHARFPALRDLFDGTSDELNRALETLLGDRILTPGTALDEPLTLSDSRWFAAALGGLRKSELRQLHAAVLACLNATGAPPLEIARHELALASTAGAYQRVLDAAEHERDRGRLSDARSLVAEVRRSAPARFASVHARGAILEARLELGQGSAAHAAHLLEAAFGDGLERAPNDALLLAAEAAELAGRRDRARALYERVDADDPPRAERLRAVLGLGYAQALSGDAEGAISKTAGVVRITDPDDVAGAILNLRGGAFAQLGRLDEAEEVLAQAMRRADACADPTLLARTELNRALVYRRRRKPAAAVEALLRARAALERTDHVKLRALVANNLGVLHRDLGWLSDARQLIDESLLLRRRVGDAHGAASSFTNLGLVSLDRGQAGLAYESLARALTILEQGAYEQELEIASLYHGLAAALLDRRAEAEDVLSAFAGSTRRLLLARIRAALLLGGGEAGAAIDELERACIAQREHDDAAELFRAASWWLVLSEGDVRAREIVRECATQLDSTARWAEAEWLERPRRAPTTREEAARLLRVFRRAGRIDLVRAVANAGAADLNREADPDRRRRMMARAREASEALVDGVAEETRRQYLEKLDRLSRNTDPTREARLSADWLLSWNRRLARGQNLEELLLSIVDAALEVSDGQCGFLVLLDGDEPEIRIARGMDHSEMLPGDIRLSRSIVREAIRTREPISTANASEDARFSASKSVQRLELRSVLCVPLPQTGSLRGAIYVAGDVARACDEFDIEAVRCLADQATIAIEDMRRREEIDALNERLREQVELRELELEDARAALRQSGVVPPSRAIDGDSRAVRALLKDVDRYAPTELPILLRGPEGFATDALAKAIHDRSSRSRGPFRVLDCSALAELLQEAELFGLEGGPDGGRAGLFLRADGGTLFVESVDALALRAQEGLARFLETRSFHAIGARRRLRADVRLIASSSAPLDERVIQGTFHRRLRFQLAVAELQLPPLATRVEDIPHIVRRTVRELSVRHETDKEVDASVVAALARRSWPGDVRELTSEVARLFFMSDGDIDDPGLVRDTAPPAGGGSFSMPESLRLDDVERVAIVRALAAAGQNKERAAKLLGISRAGIYTKMRRLGLLRDGPRAMR